VASLARLGAIVLLFTIGLEFEFKEITQLRYGVIALLGIMVPWGTGFWLARLFDFDFSSSVFIGTAVTATSIAITANVLAEMGKLKTRAARAIMGAAIIDDVLALLALTVSEQLVSQSLNGLMILFGLGKATGFLVIVVWPLRLLLRRVMLWFDGTNVARKFPETIFIFAMIIAFLYSIGAEAAGLSAVVGSFMAGVSFASIELRQGKIFREGADYLKIIFASIFFVSLGVLLDIHVINGELVIFIVALTAVAAVSKVIGCGAPALLYGYGVRDSSIIGVGMMPRGEVAMIVALIGLSRGWIQQDTYAALVLMALLTTIIPPLLLRNWLFERQPPASKTDS
jgi:Kef-type K+ transport system membrane component KefB